jgi:hypothetical protein
MERIERKKGLLMREQAGVEYVEKAIESLIA